MSKRRFKKKKYIPYTPKRPIAKSSLLPVQATAVELTNVLINGFAAANALPGETLVPILVRASLTSDEREFHVYAEGLLKLLSERAKEIGILLSIDALLGFVLIIHKDKSAKLYLDNTQMAAEVLTKRAIKAGEAMYLNDIGDIRKITFPNLTFLPSDKIFICFKVGWKFGMFFDLAENRDLDVNQMEFDLGALYRRLQFQALYEALADQATVNRMIKAGWFPFIEVIGGDFDPLLKAYQSEFDIENNEKKLVEKFTPERIDKIGERWWKNPILFKHKTVLEAGLEAFKRGDSVSCIKNIMTEIEGVLSDLHLAEKGSTAKTKDLLNHAVRKGVEKADGEASLFFPKDFLEYLQEVAYADFDPNSPSVAGASRHTVGHGYAGGETYTIARALQVILTLDQIVFYL